MNPTGSNRRALVRVGLIALTAAAGINALWPADPPAGYTCHPNRAGNACTTPAYTTTSGSLP